MKKGKFSLEYFVVIAVLVSLIGFIILAKPPTLTPRVIWLEDEILEITIFSPQVQVYASNSVLLNATLNRVPDSLKVYLDSEMFSVNNGTKIIANIGSLSEGSHTITISAIVNVTETNSSVSFSVDTIEPKIILQLPVNNSQIWPSSVTFSVNYTELNLKEVVLFWKLSDAFENISLECASGISQLCSKQLDLSNAAIGSVLQYYFALSDSSGRVSESSLNSLAVVSCTQNWVVGEWQACQDGDIKYRDWTDLNNCNNDTGKPGRENQTCDYCNPNWDCGSWTDCSNSQKTRTCNDLNSCNEDESKPNTTRNCTEETTATEATKQTTETKQAETKKPGQTQTTKVSPTPTATPPNATKEQAQAKNETAQEQKTKRAGIIGATIGAVKGLKYILIVIGALVIAYLAFFFIRKNKKKLGRFKKIKIMQRATKK